MMEFVTVCLTRLAKWYKTGKTNASRRFGFLASIVASLVWVGFFYHNEMYWLASNSVVTICLCIRGVRNNQEGVDMNAAEMRKLTETTKDDHQTQIEEAKAAAEAAWLATGIANVERYIQAAAANQRSFYRHACGTCPDFVVEHFKALGFEVQVSTNMGLECEFSLCIGW